ncbi:MAG TPA: ice-binding family protein [bacterium]|nr:ice-binding family protein [bacterium]HXB97172.1 ice-binding family protein [bacterium]
MQIPKRCIHGRRRLGILILLGSLAVSASVAADNGAPKACPSNDGTPGTYEKHGHDHDHDHDSHATATTMPTPANTPTPLASATPISKATTVATATSTPTAAAAATATPTATKTSGSSSIAVPASVNLGAAANFVILAESGITNVGATSITGDIGVYPIAATAVTGFGLVLNPGGQSSTSGLVQGLVYAADYASPTPANLLAAVNAMQTAYTYAAGVAPGVTQLDGGNIGGLSLSAGVYQWSTAVNITSNLTLTGSSTDVWIFQIANALTLANGVQVNLAGGALASHVFWQVAGVTALGTSSVLNGTVLDATAITMNSGASLNGHALAQTDVTLIGDTIQ